MTLMRRRFTDVDVFESTYWHRYLPALKGMQILCFRFGLEFCECHRTQMAYDIVGPHGFEKMEVYRTAGVLFRYFDSHAERLADFQSRLDAAKRRTTRA